MVSPEYLPFVFAGLLGVSVLLYVIMDGFDLGVGLLFPFATADEKDKMIASIGPFWDANETWLVLAVGILLVAFPSAHGQILTALYLPVLIMLVGLILRGVSFEFRAKVEASRKPSWNMGFFVGSLMASTSQGFMLGLYIMGLEWTLANVAFAIVTAAALPLSYALIGATWLILKAEDKLHSKAILWARRAMIGGSFSLISVSIATPLVSERIFDKWFSFPSIVYLSPFPIFSALLTVFLFMLLHRKTEMKGSLSLIPFMIASSLMALGFTGLAYSFFPYIVPDQLLISDAAASPESLQIILYGALAIIPVIVAYTALSFRIFKGKAQDLSYS